MPLPEAILGAITKAVFSSLLQQGRVSDQIQRAFGRDPVQQAFQRSLGKACEALERQHPDWVANSFDPSFFEHEGASLLAQFLVWDGHPDPSELAVRWATTLYHSDSERQTVLTCKLEPVAADFLETLAHTLRGEKALDELNNHRAWDQFATDMALIRGQLGAGKTTRGTAQISQQVQVNKQLRVFSGANRAPRCAIIHGVRGAPERACATSPTPPSAARSARCPQAGVSLQTSTAAPEALHLSGILACSRTPRWRTREKKRPHRLSMPRDALPPRPSSLRLLAMASPPWRLVGSH